MIKRRLSALQNKDSKRDLLWKPVPGKQLVRLLPYKHNTSMPFIELKFYYNLNGKTYLSPSSFNRPDPIVEFCDKLRKSGDKEEWKLSRKLEPKMRTFAPVLVRGLEQEGVKFWGFGKQVYQAILAYMADPDYSDVTDLVNGRDIVVEFKTAEETKKQYPETAIRPKPNTNPAVDPNNKELIEKLGNQPNILELFDEPTYDELKTAMDAWLHPEDQSDEGVVTTDASVDELEASAPTTSSPKTPTLSVSSVDDVAKAFDKLFNS
jgi:hypothetical protein